MEFGLSSQMLTTEDNTISQIVPFVVLVAMYLIVYYYRTIVRKSREHQRALKHIDVNVRDYHAEK
jgi:preprotein translocase subunit YajC